MHSNRMCSRVPVACATLSPASAWTVVCVRSPTAGPPTASSSFAWPAPPGSGLRACVPRSAHAPPRIPAPVVRTPRDSPDFGSTVSRSSASVLISIPPRRVAAPGCATTRLRHPLAGQTPNIQRKDLRHRPEWLFDELPPAVSAFLLCYAVSHDTQSLVHSLNRHIE